MMMDYDLALLQVTRLMMLNQKGPALPIAHGLRIKTYLHERVGTRAFRISGLRMPTELDEVLEIWLVVRDFYADVPDLDPPMLEALAWLEQTSMTLLRPRLEAQIRGLPISKLAAAEPSVDEPIKSGHRRRARVSSGDVE